MAIDGSLLHRRHDNRMYTVRHVCHAYCCDMYRHWIHSWYHMFQKHILKNIWNFCEILIVISKKHIASSAKFEMLTLRCMSPNFWRFDKEQDTKCLIMKWNWEFDPIVLDNEISRTKHYHHLSTLFVYKYKVPVNNISVISWQSGLLVLIYIYIAERCT